MLSIFFSKFLFLAHLKGFIAHFFKFIQQLGDKKCRKKIRIGVQPLKKFCLNVNENFCYEAPFRDFL